MANPYQPAEVYGNLWLDTNANWRANDPVVPEGLLAHDTTTRTTKVGDGVTAWTALSTATVSALDGAELTLSAAAAYPEITNTTVDSDLWRWTVPAGTLAVPGSSLRFSGGGRIVNNSGGDLDLTWRIPYGDGYGITAAAVTLSTSANPRKWWIDIVATQAYADGSTSNTGSLEFTGLLVVTSPGSGEWRLQSNTYVGQGTTVRSPLVDNDVAITTQWSAADPDATIDLRSLSASLIPAL